MNEKKYNYGISVACISNQIVHVCLFVSNFQISLVPPPSLFDDGVSEYFAYVTKTHSEYYVDSESSDDNY